MPGVISIPHHVHVLVLLELGPFRIEHVLADEHVLAVYFHPWNFHLVLVSTVSQSLHKRNIPQIVGLQISQALEFA